MGGRGVGGVIFGGDLINNVENQPEDDSTSSDVQTHLLSSADPQPAHTPDSSAPVGFLFFVLFFLKNNEFLIFRRREHHLQRSLLIPPTEKWRFRTSACLPVWDWRVLKSVEPTETRVSDSGAASRGNSEMHH